VRGVIRWTIPLVLVAAGGWAGARALRGTKTPTASVPTFTVQKVPFTRTVKAEGVLKALKTTVIKAPSNVRDSLLVVWMLEDGDRVEEGDVAVRFDGSEINRRIADEEGAQAAANGRIEKEKIASKSSRSDRDRAAALTTDEIKRSQQLGKKDPRFFPRAEVIESEIDDGLYEARLAHARSARQIEEKLAHSNVRLIEIERREADIDRQRAKEALNKLEMRAPHDGTFVLQRWGSRGVLRAGDRVYRGMQIAEITRTDQLDAEVYVLEADAGGLAADKPAEVVLEARPDVTWKAKVKKVDPFPKPLQPEVPAQYFTALLGIEGDTSALKPGQRLHATIRLADEARALVVPRQAVFRRDNDTVVYRRGAGGFEPVTVKLAAGTAGRLVVSDGVSVGDELALRDPSLSADEVVLRQHAKRRASGPTLPGAGARGP